MTLRETHTDAGVAILADFKDLSAQNASPAAEQPLCNGQCDSPCRKEERDLIAELLQAVARGQHDTWSRAEAEAQMNRIKHKLDQLLKILDQAP